MCRSSGRRSSGKITMKKWGSNKSIMDFIELPDIPIWNVGQFWDSYIALPTITPVTSQREVAISIVYSNLHKR